MFAMEQLSQFDLARLGTLKEYAKLEYELCLLLRNLLKVDDPVAAAIFYQISNTRARYAIISRLIKLKPEPQWRAWTKIESWLGPCDTARNHLVHWFEGHSTTVYLDTSGDGGAGRVERTPLLRNAARSGTFSPDEKRYRLDDILEERDRVGVMHRIVNRLQMTVWRPDEWPWTEIFQQPVGDQTPVGFLQLLNERGHEALLPPYDR